MAGEIMQLVKREIASEWKQKYAFGGVLLYTASAVFICRLCLGSIPDPLTWSALFWIILLFASVNASAKSFLQETRGRLLYFYFMAGPRSIILSKIIYNLLLTLLLSLLCYLLYILFLGDPITNRGLFFLTVLLGATGFSCILTMVSAIASKTNNNFSLMAVLSFPLIFPLIMTLIRLSRMAIEDLPWSVCYKYILILALIDLIVVLLSYLLFPYLWRD
ncbi:MAG: heme exporter protein CcmB [Bacteroidota bacterium]